MTREDMKTDDLTNKWNKGELTTPRYIRALQEHAVSLEQRNTEVEQKNSILKKAFIARSEQEKINLLNWEELALGLKQKVKELENNAVMYRNELLEAIEPNTCGSCKYWYKKSCMNNDGIAYGTPNAVYEYDYCKDYESKTNE